MKRPARVVVTGVALLTPLGTTWRENLTALVTGRSGIRQISLFDCSALPVHIGGEVGAWSPKPGGRIRAMLTDACKCVVTSSQVDLLRSRVGLSLGIGQQPIDITSVEKSPDKESSDIWEYEDHVATLADSYGFRGPSLSAYTACASGNDAIGMAFHAVRSGEVDAMICGAADAQLSPVAVLELAALNALAIPDGDGRLHPRPFDRDRKGFVVGEGAALFVIENADRAQRRGARIFGELLGYGASSDAYSLTRGRPDGDGPVQAMESALADAGLDPNAVDYVNAHGTGTLVNDVIEARAIKRVFNGRPRVLPVSSTKSMTGHLLAAAGAAELAFCLMALAEQFVPPTLNHQHRDPECDLDCVHDEARQATLRTVMSNTFGFGGQNAVLVVGRFDK